MSSEDKQDVEASIKELNEKVKQLEQSKEHWKLEFQLLEMKYQKIKVTLTLCCVLKKRTDFNP